MILDGVDADIPNILTFWGVGLAGSDLDLMAIYRTLSGEGVRVEFVNPDTAAFNRAKDILGREIVHHLTLDSWLAPERV